MNILHRLFQGLYHACPPEDVEGVDATEHVDECMASRSGLVPAIRASLNAKLERLLRRPIIARIGDPAPDSRESCDDAQLPDVFRVLLGAVRLAAPATGAGRRANPWREDPTDGTFAVSIVLDYADLWRGCEKEILEAVTGTVENHVTFLTDEQKLLLERSPREFLALEPRPETAELLAFQTRMIGGGQRVVELTVAAAPKSPANVHHLAIVPNLIQLERQLDALRCINAATDDGAIAPLRVLLGLCDARGLPSQAVVDDTQQRQPSSDRRLDEYQSECVRKALTTPHFSVIKGPPGSGKTTVITSIIRRALARGERILVVSPTHVAVDNVVEKLAPQRESTDRDDLEARSLPVRYAARPKKLSQSALAYWIGPKKERRGATIAGRVERCLSEKLPLARALYAIEDKDEPGHAPLSAAIAGVHGIICGTPIGVLSFEPVKNAEPGSFDLLIVDEVSKMTLPEFLAIAVKARRWVLVGDPDQLPPYNNGEENGTTLDDILDPQLELVCSVGGILERAHPAVRHSQRLVVVSSSPTPVVEAIRAHLAAVGLDSVPPVALFDEAHEAGVVVCAPAQADDAVAFLSPVRVRDRTHNPEQSGTVSILVERGIRFERPAFASGTRLVEPRLRAPVLIFDNAFAVYHAQPWTVRAGQKLRLVGFRNGIDKYLPSAEGLAVLRGEAAASTESRAALIEAIAERFAVNAVSVYDWLTGIPTEHFDTSPLLELDGIVAPLADLRAAVRPFVGTLKKQYRMHSSLSRVPRDLFYFREALEDGARDARPGCRVRLVQVESRGQGEANDDEAKAICESLEKLNAADAAGERRPGILVITPYRAQERRIAEVIDAVKARGGLEHLDVEVCTLDRCQGREAEYVFISLVRGRATPFLDVPKRWNVALTRAMQGLFIVGDIDAYLREANAARRDVRARNTDGRPLMSLLARILEAYDLQISSQPSPFSPRYPNARS